MKKPAALLCLMISYILRLLLPYLMRRFVQRVEKQFTEQFNNTAKQKQAKREGQVSINQTDKKEKKVDKNVGDYIDFEEEK
ncbi:MAG: DUF4834 family protein [Prevotellaceae bacterium]|jgi:hypothetical protein|nr:DUF4834 family protein [Prevotellaceae bacterium]